MTRHRFTAADLAKTARGRKALGWASEAPARKPRKPRAPKPGHLTGEQLKQQIADLAALCGWTRMAIRRARQGADSWVTPMQYDGKGWPDLFLAHEERGRVLILECKGDDEAVSADQRMWHRVLLACDLDARIVRPEDWLDIEAILTGKEATR